MGSTGLQLLTGCMKKMGMVAVLTFRIFLQAHHQHHPHPPDTYLASVRSSMSSRDDEEQPLLNKSHQTQDEETAEKFHSEKKLGARRLQPLPATI